MDKAKLIQYICEILKSMGTCKAYYDGHMLTLYYIPHKVYATADANKMVATFLKHIGFTDVQNRTEKKDLYHAIYVITPCEYNLEQNCIQSMNTQEAHALRHMYLRHINLSNSGLTYTQYIQSLKNYCADNGYSN